MADDAIYRFLIVSSERYQTKRGNLVGERGFEPPTHTSRTCCATRLRYSPNAGRILLLPY